MTTVDLIGPRDNPGYRVERDWGSVMVRLRTPIHEGDEPYAAIAWMLSMERRAMERAGERKKQRSKKK